MLLVESKIILVAGMEYKWQISYLVLHLAHNELLSAVLLGNLPVI